MNYYEIGQRIRKFRKAHDWSQELLAEKVGISVTHMSHIETGNTKLSLPVFVKLTEVLEVPADDLLKDQPSARSTTVSELNEILERCSTAQIRVILDIVRATKTALDKYQSL